MLAAMMLWDGLDTPGWWVEKNRGQGAVGSGGLLWTCPQGLTSCPLPFYSTICQLSSQTNGKQVACVTLSLTHFAFITHILHACHPPHPTLPCPPTAPTHPTSMPHTMPALSLLLILAWGHPMGGHGFGVSNMLRAFPITISLSTLA